MTCGRCKKRTRRYEWEHDGWEAELTVVSPFKPRVPELLPLLSSLRRRGDVLLVRCPGCRR